MKKLLTRPGFETIFALSIAAIIGLPPLVFGQDKTEDKKPLRLAKKVDIRITDGDTVINGKNIKELTTKEREDYLVYLDRPVNGRITLKRRTNDSIGDVLVQSMTAPMAHLRIMVDSLAVANGDVLKENRNIELRSLGVAPPAVIGLATGPVKLTRTAAWGRNTQSFNYNNVDNDGIATHVSFTVTNATNDEGNRTTTKDKPALELQNINIAPKFSTGKTTLSFSLENKAPAEVSYKDSKGKILWTEKATNGTFSKSFLALNGVYYLTVKQSSAVAVKRIVKED